MFKNSLNGESIFEKFRGGEHYKNLQADRSSGSDAHVQDDEAALPTPVQGTKRDYQRRGSRNYTTNSERVISSPEAFL